MAAKNISVCRNLYFPESRTGGRWFIQLREHWTDNYLSDGYDFHRYPAKLPITTRQLRLLKQQIEKLLNLENKNER